MSATKPHAVQSVGAWPLRPVARAPPPATCVRSLSVPCSIIQPSCAALPPRASVRPWSVQTCQGSRRSVLLQRPAALSACGVRR
jgi:hypothetical protein